MYKMILNKLIKRIKLAQQVNKCLLCTQTEKSSGEIENPELPLPKTVKQPRPPSKKHLLELDQFFLQNPHLQPYKEIIPPKLLYYVVPRNVKVYNMYLICPKTAKKVVKTILPIIKSNKNQVVAEVNPGLGFIAKEMIERGVPVSRLYESNVEFQEYLKNKFETNQIKISSKNFFKLSFYGYLDYHDNRNRLNKLFEQVPKKSWVDDPVLTLVGTMTDTNFIKYLIKAIVLQKELAIYGRTEIIAMLLPYCWATLSSTVEGDSRPFKPWTILFQILFDVKLLDTLPRKLFVPWKSTMIKKRSRILNEDHVYLAQISMKKDFCLNAKNFVPFYCFVKSFFGSGSKRIIPVCEKWLPGSGLNLLSPKLTHQDYYEEMNIFTKFKELNSKQIVAVFNEFINHPDYHTSPFMDMVEQEMAKSESLATDAFEYKKKR